MKNLQSIILAIVFVVITTTVFGQPAGGGPPGGPAGGGPPCWPPPCVPIDGGLGFLIAIGAAMGIKTVYSAKKK